MRLSPIDIALKAENSVALLTELGESPTKYLSEETIRTQAIMRDELWKYGTLLQNASDSNYRLPTLIDHATVMHFRRSWWQGDFIECAQTELTTIFVGLGY